jgi:hypothetical protein
MFLTPANAPVASKPAVKHRASWLARAKKLIPIFVPRKENGDFYLKESTFPSVAHKAMYAKGMDMMVKKICDVYSGVKTEFVQHWFGKYDSTATSLPYPRIPCCATFHFTKLALFAASSFS